MVIVVVVIIVVMVSCGQCYGKLWSVLGLTFVIVILDIVIDNS